ncbi:MAG TPA: protein kinase, partial [Rariglobus sp.]
ASPAIAVALHGGRTVRVDACELRTVDGRHFDRRHLGHDVDDRTFDGASASSRGDLSAGDNGGDMSDASPMRWPAHTDAAADTMLSAANTCRNMIDPQQIEMGEQIGMGAYGIVHRGRWRGVDVAVKRFVQQKQDESQRMDFRAEVAVLSEARHPNVVLFIGACMRAPDVCIVTEWVRGGNLRDLLARPSAKVTWRAKLGIVRGIALGLDYLHSTVPEAIMHRDLKPSNVLVSPGDTEGTWTAKLADFGLSRTKREMATMTRCGTPAWTAPEIIKGQDYSEKADIYALGIVMWEVLTRRRPYADANFMSISLDVLDGKRPEVPPGCPDAYASLMTACWHRKPHKRPTAADVAAALLALDGTSPV